MEGFKISAVFIFCIISINFTSGAKEERTSDLVDKLLEVLREKKEEAAEKDVETRASRGPCNGAIGLLDSPTGTVSTPRYGTHRYPNSARCRWSIRGPAGSKIRLKFKTPFSIEEGPNCAYDSLSLFAGSGDGAPPIGRYCNSNAPPVNLETETSSVFVLFKSDFSVAGAGFTFDYTIVAAPASKKDACKGEPEVLEAENGTITSQNYPQGYGEDLDCQWRIQVPQGKLVHLDVEDFNLEADVGCPYDSLSIYDGSSDAAKAVGKFCGKRVPQDMTMSGNQAFIKFVTDGSVSRKGFKIKYSAVQATTAPPSSGGKNETTPAPGPQIDLSCNFEQNTMCIWAPGAGGNINWKLKTARRNTYIISNGERWGGMDHTLGTSSGHYIVIDGNEDVAPNTRGYLITPLLTAGPEGGRCLTLWYNMFYTKGVLQVVMRREGESDEVIWQRDGFQGNGWHRGRISLVSSVSYRLVLVGSRGTSDKETGIAVDDISFENTPCLSIPLNCGQGRSRSRRSILDDFLERSLPSDAPEVNLTRRVIGGQPSSVGMWPWVVNIRTTPPNSNKFLACGGSLIDRQWVITAAHCFENGGKWLTDPFNIDLKLGEANVNRGAWEETQINIRPEKVIIHPQRSRESLGQVAPYDLALVKLVHPINLHEDINVVCLPQSNSIFRSGARCVVTGWGKTESGRGFDPYSLVEGSEKLLHVDLEVLTNRLCSAYFGSSIGNDLICAKHDRQVKAACKGDSGGPLVCRVGNHYVLAGVVSWGIPCSLHDRPLPSVFSKITYYLPWIESTINSEQ